METIKIRNEIENRSEIVFLYDMKLNNPNGDPMNGNAPRIDEETGKCIVTDVRLKRTVRDYLFEKGYNGTKSKDIFIREIVKNGFTKDVKTRSKDFLIANNDSEEENKLIQSYIDKKMKPADKKKHKQFLLDNERKNILAQCIDIRLFGGTLAQDITEDNKKGDSITFTGPVQFGMGISLNKVQQKSIAHSFVMASRDDATSGSLAEENIIKYGLFGFHGVINENAAIHTNLSENDIKELIDGLWNGTKNLLTRSKKGQMPRLLIKIDYTPGFFIGDLVEKIKLIPNDDINEEDYSDITDFTIDTTDLISTLKKYKEKIIGIEMLVDDRVTLSEDIPTIEQLKSKK